MRKAVLHFVLLGMMATATAHAQSYPESGMCLGDVAVGEIPNSPFTADLVEQHGGALPDGTHDPHISVRSAGYVARDRRGRVVVRLTLAPDAGQPRPETTAWHETLCDPHGVARLWLVQRSRASDHVAENRKPFQRTTEDFNTFHKPAPGREHLGAVTFENLPAFFYRTNLTKTRSYDEAIMSDRLAVEFLFREGTYRPPSIREVRMSNLRFGEPPERLFEIPAWARAAANSTPVR